VVGTSASRSEDSGIKPQSGDRTNWHNLFDIFLSPSKQMPAQHLTKNHDASFRTLSNSLFITLPFWFIIQHCRFEVLTEQLNKRGVELVPIYCFSSVTQQVVRLVKFKTNSETKHHLNIRCPTAHTSLDCRWSIGSLVPCEPWRFLENISATFSSTFRHLLGLLEQADRSIAGLLSTQSQDGGSMVH
jgi:hypothetical protein